MPSSRTSTGPRLNDWDALGARDRESGAIHVVIDTPAGSRNKYKYDEAKGVFRLHKVLPLGTRFPFDFGFIPATRSDDGDALDVIVLGEEPLFVGCLVTVRVLGVIEADQTEKGKTIRNDRVVATPETEKIRPTLKSLKGLPPRVLDQIEQFFVGYNRAEGREFKPRGRRGPRVAAQLIEQSERAYSRSKKSDPGRSRKGSRG